MPTRENDAQFRDAIRDIRIRFPDDIGFRIDDIETTIEADTEEQDEIVSYGSDDRAGFTATVDVPRDNSDLIAELIGGHAPQPQPDYQEFVEVQAASRIARDMTEGLTSSATATSYAFRNALRRMTENTRAAFLQGRQQSPQAYSHSPHALDLVDALAYAGVSAEAIRQSTESFLESINNAWAKLSDDYELGDESQYVNSDPISFDELMGFGGESR